MFRRLPDRSKHKKHPKQLQDIPQKNTTTWGGLMDRAPHNRLKPSGQCGNGGVQFTRSLTPNHKQIRGIAVCMYMCMYIQQSFPISQNPATTTRGKPGENTPNLHAPGTSSKIRPHLIHETHTHSHNPPTHEPPSTRPASKAHAQAKQQELQQN